VRGYLAFSFFLQWKQQLTRQLQDLCLKYLPQYLQYLLQMVCVIVTQERLELDLL
jgi:hypothetical protein